MIIPFNHPQIHRAVDKLDFKNPPAEPVSVAETLVKCMIDNNGVGLAAPQLGMPFRVFAMVGQPNLVCFNPIIVDSSDDLVEMEEGCLSYPGLVLKVKRPRAIKMRYAEPNGNVITREFVGMTARIAQHELDHLNGIAFTDQVSRLRYNMAKRKAAKTYPQLYNRSI